MCLNLVSIRTLKMHFPTDLTARHRSRVDDRCGTEMRRRAGSTLRLRLILSELSSLIDVRSAPPGPGAPGERDPCRVGCAGKSGQSVGASREVPQGG